MMQTIKNMEHIIVMFVKKDMMGQETDVIMLWKSMQEKNLIKMKALSVLKVNVITRKKDINGVVKLCLEDQKYFGLRK